MALHYDPANPPKILRYVRYLKGDWECFNIGEDYPVIYEDDDNIEIQGKLESALHINKSYYKNHFSELNDLEPYDRSKHYKQKVEPIDLIEAFDLGFNRGNVIKYVARAGRKDNELEDLKKALWYLQREIKNLEDGE